MRHDAKSVSAPASQDAHPKRRLSALTARLVLAREMWARDNQTDYWAWDEDTLLSGTYERYVEKADALIREEMARG